MAMSGESSVARQHNERRATVAQSLFAGKRVHFVGIGGSGMAGLAKVLHDRGAVVSGSDPKPSGAVLELMQQGVGVCRKQDGSYWEDWSKVDLVVRSAAVKDDNAEYAAAVRAGVLTVKYARLLGMVMGESLGVAVAGTHGKSTTSGMLSYVLTQLGADPSFVVGGTVPQLGGGSRSGSGPVFVAEACEYDRSFHNLRPTVAIVTNIEADHLDIYKDLDEIVGSFADFARLVPAEGRIVTLGGSEPVSRAMKKAQCKVDKVWLDTDAPAVQTDALEDEDSPGKKGDVWTVRPVENHQARVGLEGEIRLNGVLLGKLSLSVPGVHNLLNATMAVAAAKAVGMDVLEAMRAAEGFTGVDRRMTKLGRVKVEGMNTQGALVVDDYGHHPTEVRVTLAALRKAQKPGKLWCVFQPHQASRTRLLLEEFAGAFADADRVLLPEIYYVRDSDEDKRAVSSALLAGKISKSGTAAEFVESYDQAVRLVRQACLTGELGANDLVVTMGAGPVCEVGKELVGGS